MAEKKKAKGLPKRVGRKTGAAKRARHHLRLPEKKLRRLLKHNSFQEAWEWADQRGHAATLRKLVRAKLQCPDETVDRMFVEAARRKAKAA